MARASIPLQLPSNFGKNGTVLTHKTPDNLSCHTVALSLKEWHMIPSLIPIYVRKGYATNCKVDRPLNPFNLNLSGGVYGEIWLSSINNISVLARIFRTGDPLCVFHRLPTVATFVNRATRLYSALIFRITAVFFYPYRSFFHITSCRPNLIRERIAYGCVG